MLQVLHTVILLRCYCALTHAHTHSLSFSLSLSRVLPVCSSGWLRSVGSIKSLVSFAEYRLFYRALLQKRPRISRSLLIVATPYGYCTHCHFALLLQHSLTHTDSLSLSLSSSCFAFWAVHTIFSFLIPVYCVYMYVCMYKKSTYQPKK